MVRITKRGISKELENQLFDILLKKIKIIKKREDLFELLNQLLTSDEQIMIKKRLAINLFVEQGKRFKDIKETLDVSGATISFVKRGLKKLPKKEKKIGKITKMDFKKPSRKIRRFPAYTGKGRWSFLNQL